jgi:hypothetical protein
MRASFVILFLGLIACGCAREADGPRRVPVSEPSSAPAGPAPVSAPPRAIATH